MRIALDARTAFGPQRRGIGKTLVELYTHLAAVRPDWRVNAFHRSDAARDDALPGNVTARSVEMPGDRFDAWQRWRLPIAARLDRCDVLHCPANHCPEWMPMPAVVTIHDLIPLDMPHGRPAAEVRRFEQSVRHACNRAARVVTPSAYTRQRLIDDYHADPDRTHVIAWAADSRLTADDAAMNVESYLRLKDALRLDEPFVLHFGAGEIRKNTRRVIEAWAMVKPSIRRSWRLVIVGLDARTFEDMHRCATRLNITKSLSLQGFLDDTDVLTLLHAAHVLAYPSLVEGFGLPVLDAFATETAVLTADSGAIREVAGDAAHYTDPTDACSIAKSLSRLMTEPSYRHHLVSRGRNRVTGFSWRATAEQFARVIEDVSANGQPRSRAA
jgi:glycosyltransferase involved in cell wall biosynthesis